jgi:futalosine hydrolase
VTASVALQENTWLVCAATWNELLTFDARIEPTVGEIGFGRQGKTLFLVTGVGIPRALERVLLVASHEHPSHILNIGIAGAYPSSGLRIGNVVTGDSEVYGDLGMELPEAPGFQALHETPFGSDYTEPFVLRPETACKELPVGRGCTVNTCTGTDATGLRREHLFAAAFETMEGAAVAQAGHTLGIPVTEIRAISNIAARRDMQPANIKLALSQLADFFQQHRESFHA